MLEDLIRSWNILIEFTQHRLSHNISLPDVVGWDEFAKPLQFALMTIDRVIADVGWIWRGDKNYQSKAGQAFQGVELKKIET